jgi:hypothetical protein
MALGVRNRVAGTVKRVHGASNGCTPALTGGNAQAAGRCKNRLHTQKLLSLALRARNASKRPWYGRVAGSSPAEGLILAL